MVEEYEKVVFVSHCIMNQSTRAWWGDGGASREKGMISDVVRVLMRYGIGMVQMDSLVIRGIFPMMVRNCVEFSI